MIHTYIYIYITAIALTPSGSSTSHIYTQTKYRKRRIGKCRLCPVFASSLTLSIRVFANRVLKRIFGPKRDEETG
jgi:hypothetical protein